MRRLKGKTLEVGDFLDGFGKEEVVRSTDIVKLFASFGVKLERKGKSYVGRCPWHEDKTPSLSVDAEKKLYNCFGCGESGDVFTLVEKMKGCSFREALEYLRREEFRYYERKETYPKETVIQQVPQDETERVTVNISPSTNDLEKINAEEVQTTLPEEDNTNGILKEVMDWYSGKLNSNAEAKAYLEQRALFDAELLTGFGIGFADGSLLEVIGEERKAELVSIGILNDKEGRVWEHFGNCVIIPVTDENGLIAGVYGRSIDDESNFKHRYLKGTHKGIFNRKASAVYKEIILTESILDAMSLIKLGFDNTQSIYGTNGFTEEHLKQLKNDRVKTVILALDNDEAGRSASIKLKEKLTGEGFSVKEISPARLPSDPQDRIEAKDWNEYLVRVSAEDGVSSAAVEIRKKIDEAEKSEREEEEKFSLERDGLYYSARSGNVKYRISGVKEMFAGSLRVAVKAETEGGSFVDSLELYSSRARGTFALNFSKAAGLEAKSVENDLIRILEGLEEERDRRILTPETEEKELTEEEKELGLSLLKSPDIFEEIVKDMDLLGYVGEDVNKKLMYLAASSRILDDPISVIILSQSSAGKSYLAETVRKLMPPEETISVTSLSDQALNYMEDLMHKFLILGETVHSDAVEHQIREMLSGKELSRLVTVKDEKTGTMRSAVVKRPVVVSAVMSGTDYGINPENASRCFVISADESREQTRRIHEKQRGKYSLDRYEEKESGTGEIERKHRCAQRMLRKVRIVNPFAEYLDFPDMLMRTRRDNDRFMDLIACVCFLRQYRKEIKESRGFKYVECDAEDYAVAYEIMVNGVLAATMRELPESTVEFYEMLRGYAEEKSERTKLKAEEISFTQREIRETSGYGQTWVKKQTKILVDYEYLIVVKGGTSRQKGFYRLVENKPLEELNLSVIPTPEKIREKYLRKLGTTGH